MFTSPYRSLDGSSLAGMIKFCNISTSKLLKFSLLVQSVVITKPATEINVVWVGRIQSQSRNGLAHWKIAVSWLHENCGKAGDNLGGPMKDPALPPTHWTQSNKTRAIYNMPPKLPLGWASILYTAREGWTRPCRLTLRPTLWLGGRGCVKEVPLGLSSCPTALSLTWQPPLLSPFVPTPIGLRAHEEGSSRQASGGGGKPDLNSFVFSELTNRDAGSSTCTGVYGWSNPGRWSTTISL